MALAGAATLVQRQSHKAERAYPPRGQFVTAGGVRLHYVAKGSGRPVVFLHGNGAMVEDRVISGVLEQAAHRCRAIAVDRPCFGHSERPRGRHWTASAQASVLPAAFRLLGIERPIVVGHSWGTLVALALGLDYPQQVSGLVLISGYYYPTPRADVALFSPSAIPALGDLLNHTVTPFIGEAMAVTDALKPGLDEKRYERDLVIELRKRGHEVRPQREYPVHYEGQQIGTLIPDLIVDDLVIVDPKVVTAFNDNHTAQMIGYLTITSLKFALLMNFKNSELEWKRVVR